MSAAVAEPPPKPGEVIRLYLNGHVVRAPGHVEEVRFIYAAYRADCKALGLPFVNLGRFYREIAKFRGIEFTQVEAATGLIGYHHAIRGVKLVNLPPKPEKPPRFDCRREIVLGDWFAQRCQAAPDGRVRTADLHRDFLEWAEDRRERRYSAKVVVGFLRRRAVKRWRNRDGVRGFAGIALADAHSRPANVATVQAAT
jgi:hypothetical protein